MVTPCCTHFPSILKGLFPIFSFLYNKDIFLSMEAGPEDTCPLTAGLQKCAKDSALSEDTASVPSSGST